MSDNTLQLVSVLHNALENDPGEWITCAQPLGVLLPTNDPAETEADWRIEGFPRETEARWIAEAALEFLRAPLPDMTIGEYLRALVSAPEGTPWADSAPTQRLSSIRTLRRQLGDSRAEFEAQRAQKGPATGPGGAP